MTTAHCCVLSAQHHAWHRVEDQQATAECKNRLEPWSCHHCSGTPQKLLLSVGLSAEA